MGKNQFFEPGKSSKLPEMQFQENFFDLFDFTSFFCLDFIKFSGPLWIMFMLFLSEKLKTGIFHGT